MNKKIIILIIIISLGVFLFSYDCQASKFLQGLTNTATQVGYGATVTPQQYAASIIKTAFTLIGIIFTILLIYGGYLYLTSQGDEKKVTSGKKTITTAIVGLIIIISGYSITYFIASRLEQPGSTPPTFDERCEDPENKDYNSVYCCDYRNQDEPACCEQSSYRGYYSCACCNQRNLGQPSCCVQSCCSTGCGCKHEKDTTPPPI